MLGRSAVVGITKFSPSSIAEVILTLPPSPPASPGIGMICSVVLEP